MSRRLPANSAARNNRSKTRQRKNQSVSQTKLLDDICDKHNVGRLSTLKQCFFVGHDGVISEVMFDGPIRGNLNACVFIIRSTVVNKMPDTLYDVKHIEDKKKEKDQRKRDAELERARLELERLKEQETKIDETTDIHGKMLDQMKQMIEPDSNKEELLNTMAEVLDTTVDGLKDELADAKPADNDMINKMTDAVDKPMTKTEARRQAAVKRARDKAIDKATRNDYNKYHRRFTENLRKKFKFTPVPEYKYVEMTINSTPSVIDQAEVFLINMPGDVKYYLVIGALQLKRDLISTIDPTYGSESVINNQNKFLEDIQREAGVKQIVCSNDVSPECTASSESGYDGPDDNICV